MKRYIQSVLIAIFFILLSTGLIYAVTSVNDQSRNVDTQISYSPDAGPPASTNVWYTDLISHTSWLCGQHGGTFFRRVDPQVTIEASACGHNANETITSITPVSGSFDVFVNDSCGNGWTPKHKRLTNVSLKMNAEEYSGKKYSAKLGIGTDNASTGSANSKISVYTTGMTHFKANGGNYGKNEKNSALAYILAECQYNIGAARSSYVQIAFWQAELTPDATSGNIQSGLFDGGNLPFSDQIDAKQEEINNLQIQIAQWEFQISQGVSSSEANRLNNQIKTANNRIDQLNKEISQLVSSNTGSADTNATSLWKEATDFGEMWDRIAAAGGYDNTIKDATPKYSDGSIKATVEYDATNRKYKVGPFSVEYLERYTGTTQLCGMTGIPELIVRKDGGNASLKFDSDWYITYAAGRNVSKYPSSYNVYPHTKENFYIEIKYQEGIESIVNLKFYFRYLTAEGGYTLYEGNIEEIQWSAVVKSSTCSDWELCDEGSRHLSSHNHGDSEDPDYCSPGNLCPHGFYYNHIDHVWVEYSSSIISKDKDIQDIAYCTGASRSYAGNRYGGTGSDNPSRVFNWSIDLTTRLEGDVWCDANPEKTNNTVIGIKDSNDASLKNIAVTVYLYDTSGNERRKAIAHNADGTQISWPQYTDANGHYKIDRLEAPGTGSNYFYVVKFEYDGQVYRHTIYMSDRNSVVNGRAGQRYAANYKNNPNYYSTSSMAVEEVVDRYAFDQSFGEITGEEPIKANDSTNGLTYTTDENGVGKGASGNLNYYGKKTTATNDTTFIDSKLESPAQNQDNENKKITDKAEYARYRMSASTYYDNTDMKGLHDRNNFRIQYPLEGWKYNMNGVAVQTGDKNKRYIAEYMLHINLGLQGRAYTDMSVLKDLYKVTMVVNEQKLTKQFNSIGETSDNVQNSSDYEATLKATLEKRKTGSSEYKYSLGLYSTDLAYQSYQRYKNAIKEVQDIKKGTELRVYVTYVVRVYNNSETNDVEFNEITDYYDENYTLVEPTKYKNTDGSFKVSIVDEKLQRNEETVADFPYYRIMDNKDGAANNVWHETKDENMKGHQGGSLVWNDEGSVGTMHKSTTASLDTLKIHTNQYAEIFTTYEVDLKGYQNMQATKADIKTRANLLGDKQNVAEISSYSTFYTKVDNDGSGLYTGFNSGWVSGKVDRDSAPNNIDTSNVINRDKYEDDTDRAIPINIAIDTHERDMYGYVWEDIKNTETGSYGIKVGNGSYDSEDKLIQNVEVTMYEVISLGKLNSDGTYNSTYDSFDYYYKVPIDYYNYKCNSDSKNAYNMDGSDLINKDTVKTSSSEVQNVDGDTVQGNYYIYGYLAGDYILRFDYGTSNSIDTKETNYYSNADGSANKNEIDNNVSKYNGQDYENTKFLDGQLDTLNDKYLDLTAKIDGKSFIDTTVSKARDNESRRMVVDAYSRTIENDRGELLRERNSAEFIESTRMFAETPIMQIEIEDPRTLEKPSNDLYQEKVEKDADKKQQVEQHRYTIKNINFGLEERANTDIKLEKYIESISMIKSGEVIFKATMLESGEVIKEDTNAMHLDKLTYLSHEKAGLVQQGFYAIAVEDDYLNDLTLKITYKIKIRNVSEVDFTGKLANLYRAEEIVNKATIAPTDKLTENIIDDMKNNANNDEGVASNATLAEILAKDDSRLKDIITGANIDENIDDDTIRPKVIIYGRYVGRFYYENAISETASGTVTVKSYLNDAVQNPTVIYPADNVVKTTVDQVVDYIDIDASLDDQGSVADATWDLSGLEKDENGYNKSLNGLLSKSSYRKISDNGLFNIYDDKDREYINDTRSNIAISYNEKLDTLQKHREMSTTKDNDKDAGRVEYQKGVDTKPSRYNSDLTRELVPEAYSKLEDKQDAISNIGITVAKTASSGTDANQMKIDNLAEVLVYSNPTGRRDTNSVPGNAMAIVNNLAVGTEEQGVWYAGFNSEKYWDAVINKKVDEGPEFASLTAEEKQQKKEEMKKDWTQYPENDAWSPEYVTVIAPTGIALRTYIKNYIVPIAILVGTIVIMMIMFGVKQVQIFRKRKED